MIQLRPYQQALADAIRAEYAAGRKAVLAVAPTGAGKTVLFSYVASGAVARGHQVLILAHRRELVRQASQKLHATGVAHGIIAPGHTATRDLVQVASVQTLGRRLQDPRYSAPALIVVDEAHHAVAGQWAQVLAAYPSARILGVTATPERADGRGLGTMCGGPFDSMVLGPQISELMDGGFLTPARVFAPQHGPDLTGVRTRGGDFEAGGLAAAMDKPSITGDAVGHYARLAPGVPAVAFCVSIRHAEDVAATFRAAGWRAVAASGETPMAQRDAAIGGLATGATQVLCVADLISEGLDVPAIGAAIALRPTKSLGLWLQQVGRGLRPAPGKERLVVLDHAGNTLRHGLPEQGREWSLEGRPKRQVATAAPKQCPSCFAMHSASASACPQCGHSYREAAEAEARKVEVVEGELQEIDAKRFAEMRKRPLKDLLREAHTAKQFHDIAKAKGYRAGWAFHAMRERKARKAVAV